MDFDHAEQQYERLKSQVAQDALTPEAFRVQVAKMLLRDDQGVFWMLDADEGIWYCNHGEGWEPGDPRAARPLDTAPSKPTPRHRRTWILAAGALIALLIGLGGLLVWQPWATVVPGGASPRTGEEWVRVRIASPEHDSAVTRGHEVAIESTITALPDLTLIHHVALVVNGEIKDRQQVEDRIQPEQTALHLSQSWLPSIPGNSRIAVVAFSAKDDPLGVAAITLHVNDSPGAVVAEPDCTPDATFVTDVTIAPGSVFPPGARMDKVWQVRNNGTCAWGVGYGLALVEGDPLGAPSVVPVSPTTVGQTADLTVTFWSPPEAGSYRSAWQLQSPSELFFGPLLILDIQVEDLAEESSPPQAPAHLQATISQDAKAVLLTWNDRADNEDAFRIYRKDVKASIGLVPANAQQFIDQHVSCGNIYRYQIIAFNAAGPAPESESVEVRMPPCASTDQKPLIQLTIVPTQVIASAPFTITFEAYDSPDLVLVEIRGLGTGDPTLDAVQTFTCTTASCTDSIMRMAPILLITGTVTEPLTMTLVFEGIAHDTHGQESDPAWATVIVRPPP